MALVKVTKLRKEYPGKPPFVAVNDISFELEDGEILGLLGPNGAGKTTTIQMLLGTLSYTSGKISYFGMDFLSNRSEILKKVVFASTYVSLPYRLTIEQNLIVFGGLYGLSRKETRQRMMPLLERFGILDKLVTQVGQLSAGQVTRLMLVKAFLAKPRVILLDEPTASLDPDVAHEVVEFLLEQRKKEKISILFTSHKMDEVTELCDRVLFLQQGVIIADDNPMKLARSATKNRIQLILGDGMKRTIAIVEKLQFPFKVDHRMIEIHLDETEITKLLSALTKADVNYTNIRIFEPTLEDYFLKMVKKK
jgi:ABC-2 type transport system ATP-binding protein